MTVGGTYNVPVWIEEKVVRVSETQNEKEGGNMNNRLPNGIAGGRAEVEEAWIRVWLIRGRCGVNRRVHTQRVSKPSRCITVEGRGTLWSYPCTEGNLEKPGRVSLKDSFGESNTGWVHRQRHGIISRWIGLRNRACLGVFNEHRGQIFRAVHHDFILHRSRSENSLSRYWKFEIVFGSLCYSRPISLSNIQKILYKGNPRRGKYVNGMFVSSLSSPSFEFDRVSRVKIKQYTLIHSWSTIVS